MTVKNSFISLLLISILHGICIQVCLFTMWYSLYSEWANNYFILRFVLPYVAFNITASFVVVDFSAVSVCTIIVCRSYYSPVRCCYLQFFFLSDVFFAWGCPPSCCWNRIEVRVCLMKVEIYCTESYRDPWFCLIQKIQTL